MIINLAKKTRLKTANKVCKEDITINPLLQTKTVTENGTVTPDVGNVGMSKVIVDVDKSPIANVVDPLLPKFGNIKYFRNGRKEVAYHCALPFVGNYSATVNTSTYSNASTINAVGYGATGTFRNCEMCQINGKTYAGYKMDGIVGTVGVGAMWYAESLYTASLPPLCLPACSVRFLVYDKGTGEITELEQEVEEKNIESVSYNQTSTLSSYCGVMQKYVVALGVTANQLLLAAELVYPKVNITFSSYTSSISYSVDDGETYLPMNVEMPTLVEHILLKSEDGFAWNIRTPGGENVGTIPANGDPFALYATEDTKFWISAVV
jgi:hypothetical protein